MIFHSSEEKESRMKSEIARVTNKPKGGLPAVTVLQGHCLIFNCTVAESLGGGLMSAGNENGEKDISPPVIYLKNCSIQNCSMNGVEARSNGSAFLENCEIKNNDQGVASWAFSKKVVLKNCDIFNNRNEGIIAQEHHTYDTENNLVVENCNIHHNQIGLSLGYLPFLSLKGNSIYSNRSWGITMRNATIALISQNDILKNYCGGIKIAFSRFNQTLLSKNEIHDHTGPDVIQTRYFKEHLDEQLKKLIGRSDLTSELNREPILLLDNISYNNNIHYSGMGEWKIFSNGMCELCQSRKAKMRCQKCLYTSYCSKTCLNLHRKSHEDFCNYSKQQVVRFEIERGEIGRMNRLIADYTKKIPLSSKIYKREFIIKVTHGDNHYGLDRDDNDIESLLLNGATQHEDAVWVYDKYRNVSGIGKHAGLKQIIMNFGKIEYKKKICLKPILRPPLWGTDLQQENLSLCVSEKGDQKNFRAPGQK